MYLLHSLDFGVLLLQIGVVDRTETVRVGIDGGRRVADVGERGERPFFPIVLFAVRGRVGEDDYVLLVVRTCPVDEPDANTVRVGIAE